MSRTVRLLATKGDGQFQEVEWTKPDIRDNEIEVRAIMTGVCRSDIDMMQGNFGPLPLNMQGHEGLGQVTAVGKAIDNVVVGDYVATRGEPAFADYYNVRARDFVKVPEAEPHFILEPVACGINLITQELNAFTRYDARILIRGSGFLAWIAYKTLREYNRTSEVDVVGSSNKDIWDAVGVELKAEPQGEYNIILDLKEDSAVFDGSISIADGCVIVLGTSKKPAISITFEQLLWKAVKIIMPSPRHENFDISMISARFFAENNAEVLRKFWTKEYDRDKRWAKAFADGVNRPQGYSRGYIRWR